MIHFNKCSLLFLILIQILLVQSCTNEDECKSINCLNGTCQDGTCLCDYGFEGLFCENEIAPTKILISKISVLNYPTGGKPWDDDGKPDLFIWVYQKSSEILYQSPIIFEAEKDQRYEFIPDQPIEIKLENTDGTVVFHSFDYDPEGSDPTMIAIICNLYSEGDGFPKENDCWTARGEEKFHFIYELEYLFE